MTNSKIMGRVTIRIPLYKAYPEKFITLMKHVVRKHEEMGASSPLNDASVIDMADFKAKLEAADALRTESEALRGEAEAKMDQARKILGTSVGQTINTEGTLFYLIDIIKRVLLTKYRGEEESMSPFGFDVVKGKAKSGGRTKKKKLG